MRDGVGTQVAFRPGVNTDNVADLMVGKLNRLPLQNPEGITALQRLACLANRAEISAASDMPAAKLAASPERSSGRML